MPELIHRFKEPLLAPEGGAFVVCVYGEDRRPGWVGWYVFIPLGEGPTLRSRFAGVEETRDALVRWAASQTSDDLMQALLETREVHRGQPWLYDPAHPLA